VEKKEGLRELGREGCSWDPQNEDRSPVNSWGAGRQWSLSSELLGRCKGSGVVLSVAG